MHHRISLNHWGWFKNRQQPCSPSIVPHSVFECSQLLVTIGHCRSIVIWKDSSLWHHYQWYPRYGEQDSSHKRKQRFLLELEKMEKHSSLLKQDMEVFRLFHTRSCRIVQETCWLTCSLLKELFGWEVGLTASRYKVWWRCKLMRVWSMWVLLTACIFPLLLIVTSLISYKLEYMAALSLFLIRHFSHCLLLATLNETSSVQTL